MSTPNKLVHFDVAEACLRIVQILGRCRGRGSTYNLIHGLKDEKSSTALVFCQSAKGMEEIPQRHRRVTVGTLLNDHGKEVMAGASVMPVAFDHFFVGTLASNCLGQMNLMLEDFLAACGGKFFYRHPTQTAAIPIEYKQCSFMKTLVVRVNNCRQRDVRIVNIPERYVVLENGTTVKGEVKVSMI